VAVCADLSLGWERAMLVLTSDGSQNRGSSSWGLMGEGSGGEDGGRLPLTHGIPISLFCLFMDRWEGRLFTKTCDR